MSVRYEFDTPVNRRGSCSYKWDTPVSTDILPMAHVLAYSGLVFAYTAGEHNHIKAAHLGCIGSDVFDDALLVHVAGGTQAD